MFCGFCFQPCVMYQKFRLVIKIFLIRGIRMACFCIFTEQLWWVCTKHLHFVLYWTNMYTCWYFPSQKIPESHTSVSKIQPPPTPFSLMRDCHLVEHRRHFWFGLRQNCDRDCSGFQRKKEKSLSLCDPMDCSPPGSSVRGIFQARVLEWVSISFSRGSSWPRDWTLISRIVGRRFTVWTTREVLGTGIKNGRLPM